jgi:hypothetical protein
VALQPDGLTDAIETAYEQEWAKVKPNPLPDAGKDDRRLLFAGVARGVLQYLVDHQNELLASISAQDDAGTQLNFQVQQTSLGISTG